MKMKLGCEFFTMVLMLFIGWAFAQSRDSNNSDGLSSSKKKVLINPYGTVIVYHTW